MYCDSFNSNVGGVWIGVAKVHDLIRSEGGVSLQNLFGGGMKEIGDVLANRLSLE